jgi:hypothetical protein
MSSVTSISSHTNNTGIVPPWLSPVPAKNPGIVPPWLTQAPADNSGIVPPWLQVPVHTLPVDEQATTVAAGETQFVPAPTSLSPMSLVDALRAR